jgi:hypothetical protein
MTTDSRTASHLRNEQPISYLRELRLFLLNKEKFQNEKTKLMMLTVIFGTQLNSVSSGTHFPRLSLTLRSDRMFQCCIKINNCFASIDVTGGECTS